MADLTPEQIAAFERSLSPEQRAALRVEAARRYDQQTAGMMPAVAFQERLAGAATLGGTDWLARKFDPTGADDMALRAEANPVAAGLGNVVGGVGLGLATGGLAAGAARGLGGGFLARTAVGAAEGSLYGLGSVVSEESLGDRELTADKLLAGARTGGLVGGGLTAVGLGLAKGVSEAAKRSKWVTGKLDEWANVRAVQWLKPTKHQAGQMKDMADIGAYLHEKGVVGLSTEDAIEKLKTLRGETYTKQVEPLLAMADAKRGFDLNRAVARIDKEVLEPLSKNALDADTYNLIKTQRDRLASNEPSFKVAQESQSKLRMLAQDQAYQGKYKHIKDMREILKTEVADQAEELLGTGIGAKYRAGMREYRYAAKPLDLAEKKLAGEMKGGAAMFNQSDWLLGLLGTSTMGPAGLALAGAKALARPRAGPLTTIAMKRAAPTIDRIAASFGRFVDGGLQSSPTWGGTFRNVLSAALAKGNTEALAAHIQLAKSDPAYLSELGLGHETPSAAAGATNRFAAVEAAAEASEAVDARMDVAMGRFLGQQGGQVPKAEAGRPSARLKEFPKLFAQLEAVHTRPELLAQMLNFPLADSMPEMSLALAAKYQLAAKHLFDTAPRNPDKNPVEAMRGPWRPSDADLQKWYRRVEVVENPLKVLEDVRRGAVTPEAVETFKAVYAPLFQDMQTRMMSRLAEYGGTLTYKQRTALGQLFPDVGRGLAPAKAALVQGSFQSAKVQAKEPGGGGDAAKGKAAEARFDNLLTETQRLEKR